MNTKPLSAAANIPVSPNLQWIKLLADGHTLQQTAKIAGVNRYYITKMLGDLEVEQLQRRVTNALSTGDKENWPPHLQALSALRRKRIMSDAELLAYLRELQRLLPPGQRVTRTVIDKAYQLGHQPTIQDIDDASVNGRCPHSSTLYKHIAPTIAKILEAADVSHLPTKKQVHRNTA